MTGQSYLLVEPQGANVGAVGDPVRPAVERLRRGLRGVLELAPVRPAADPVVQRGQVAGCDVGVDQECVLVAHIGRSTRRAHRQLQLGVVVVLGCGDRLQLHRRLGMGGGELLRPPVEEVCLDLRVAELLEGHLDLAGNLAAARRGTRSGAALSGAASALAACGQADGGSQSCGGQDELTSAHVISFGAGLTVNRRGESSAQLC